MSTTVLKPGQSQQTNLDLNEVYDMTTPGKYTVSVKRRVYQDGRIDEALKAMSNRLEIEIEERQQSQ
jgi:hypothetical protein